MSDLLQRLVNYARANLHDILPQYQPNSLPRVDWSALFDVEEEDESERDSHASHHHRGASSESTAWGASGGPPPGSGLPQSEELARCYAALDLPFGAPMDTVTKRWKTYVKQCHPDRFATEPDKIEDATELTQALTAAHRTIQAAWQRHQG